jgi:hypothetical protein
VIHLLANAGTPLLFMGAMFMLFGNAVIGVIEGFVVRRGVGRARGMIYPLAIAGNYASAFLGLLAFGWVFKRVEGWSGDELLFHLTPLIVGMTALAFVVSLVIEWPAFYFGLEPQARRVRRSVGAVVLANGVSYLLIVPYFWMLSGYTLHRQELVRDAEFLVERNAVVYYVNEEGQVVRSGLGPVLRPDIVGDAGVIGPYGWLAVVVGSDEVSLDLIGGGHRVRDRVLIEEVAPLSAHPNPVEAHPWRQTAPDLRRSGGEEWQVGHYGWAGSGLRVTRDGRVEVVAVETPFFQLEPRSATLLEGDQVLYQLGRWIVLYELETRRLAVLGRGRSPVVLLGD